MCDVTCKQTWMCVPAVDADVEVEVEDLLRFFFASGEGVHLHEKPEVSEVIMK